ncbi:lysophospholipid acyltransferase family protein [Sabulilitoribacter multivorans]|uniref:Lysophospholipid acyltransferase family protein n=1 Tax=Flaviramulus multivorans TaxID=1304750 RepID=A0ABS9IIB5_9FLAO|nr:lysophospholipid acyltransferase family protein [Flaviramulus multivorans]MCF7560286.1 lysophospholipid acyltransferase family protein [Flaviramulus multivorans]
MKKVWLHSVRAYLKLGLFFYFRRIHVRNIQVIPKDKPVLFLANHQNALLDALLIATQGNRFSYYLTRAGVFKSSFVSRILKSLQMLPVYRIRDGWNNLSNNAMIFDTCSKLFNNNEAIVIFPEGSHNINRTVRPLSKGFTRIVFETLDKFPDLDLQLIPVGVNFINAEKFPDSASLLFGEPLNAKDFVLDRKNEGTQKLRERIQLEISKLTTHISNDTYDETLKRLVDLNVDFLNPKSVNNTISSNFKKHDVKKANVFSVLKPFFKTLLIISLFGPYLIWKLLVEPKIDEVEFISTFRFAIAITLVPMWLFLCVLFIAINFSWLMAFAFLALTLCLALLTVKT